MGAQLILGAQQILMVLGAQGAQGAQTMNCTKAFAFFTRPLNITYTASLNLKQQMLHTKSTDLE